MSKNLLVEAIKYAEKGWKVFPLHSPLPSGCSCYRSDCSSIGKHPKTPNGLKDATLDFKAIEAWWNSYPDANIGVCTGNESELLVLDVDPKNGGFESLDKLIELVGSLPRSRTINTGSGGIHIYFQYPKDGNKYGNRANLGGLNGLDVRGAGGYVVAPPSKHVSGNFYTVEDEEEGIVEAPQTLLDLILYEGPKPNLPKNSTSGFPSIPEGSRNDTLFKRACALHKQGLTKEQLSSRVCEVNEILCSPPLKDEEVQRIINSALNYQPNEHLTDLGNARRLLSAHGQDIRFLAEWGKWLIWSGRGWQVDSTGEVYRRAKTVSSLIRKEALDIADEETKKAYLKFANNSESQKYLEAMIASARSESGVNISVKDLDKNPWFLNCPNGTIDLQTGLLKTHDRADLITKMIQVNFDPTAKSELWLGFLNGVTKNNSELVEFLQTSTGYSITGKTTEEVFFFLYGPGGSGKSTYINTLKFLLDEYSMTTDFNTFVKRKDSGNARNDIARLVGSRFVTSIEVEDGKSLAENLVKELTGGDKVSARFLFKEFFEFTPQFKLFLVANDLPKIRHEDTGIWRRILQIPFMRVFKDEEIDRTLKAKLCSEKEQTGILAWLVEGCLKWQKEGLKIPKVVKEATEEYRDDMDILQAFIDERCTVEKSATVTASVLYKDYLNWCCSKNEPSPLNIKKFHKALVERGFTPDKDKKARFWQGIKLSYSGELDLTSEAGAKGDGSDGKNTSQGVTAQDFKRLLEVETPVSPVTIN
jgi:putative DNA primase/helicase